MENYDKVLKEFGQLFKKSVKLFARAYENDKVNKDTLSKSDLLKSLSVEVKDQQLVISIYEYFKWVESGRKKGKKLIPIAVLVKWIKKNKIANFNRRLRNKEKVKNEDLRVNKIAWAIAISIKKHGISPRPFLTDAFKSSQLELEELLDEQTNKILDKMLKEFKK